MPPGSGDAGWSSPVARQAHNLKVVGSNPTPAINKTPLSQRLGGFFVAVPEQLQLPWKHLGSKRGRSPEYCGRGTPAAAGMSAFDPLRTCVCLHSIGAR